MVNAEIGLTLPRHTGCGEQQIDTAWYELVSNKVD